MWLGILTCLHIYKKFINLRGGKEKIASFIFFPSLPFPFLRFQHVKLFAGHLGTTMSRCGCPIGRKKDSSSPQFSNQLLRSSFGKGRSQMDLWAAMFKGCVSSSAHCYWEHLFPQSLNLPNHNQKMMLYSAFVSTLRNPSLQVTTAIAPLSRLSHSWTFQWDQQAGEKKNHTNLEPFSGTLKYLIHLNYEAITWCPIHRGI